MLRSIFSTIYFNLYYLPFKQAIKLPILLYKPHLINVSSTNSKEFKLCVNSSFKIDTGLFRKATIRSQCSKHVDNEIIETSMP